MIPNEVVFFYTVVVLPVLAFCVSRWVRNGDTYNVEQFLGCIVVITILAAIALRISGFSIDDSIGAAAVLGTFIATGTLAEALYNDMKKNTAQKV